MKRVVWIPALMLILIAGAAAQEIRQVPKGIREADKAEVESEKNIPPPQVVAHPAPRNLRGDADQLASLAQSIRTDLDSVNKGTLPKDLIPKLKRIEKLAKQLRSELNP